MNLRSYAVLLSVILLGYTRAQEGNTFDTWNKDEIYIDDEVLEGHREVKDDLESSGSGYGPEAGSGYGPPDDEDNGKTDRIGSHPKETSEVDEKEFEKAKAIVKLMLISETITLLKSKRKF
uniref:Secreted protein n=1 Tax=Thermobia domestica TaxID=89055 RepID=A4FSG4_THEDO|nr:hypothetical protein [Thermobia domestica]